MRRPAFPGEEQATANTLAERTRHRSSASSGCGSMRTPVQPSCSRCQVCDSCCGLLAPTSTKNPDRAPPKNSRTSCCSRPSGKVVRTAFPRAASRAPDPGGRARLANDLCRAEARHEINEDHFAAFAFDEPVSDHFLALVVASFHQDLGAHAADQLERRILLEDDDEIDGFKRRQHFGTRV